MATLAPSLRLLFTEIDVRWPHRDRRTDGWLRNCRYAGPSSSDHCPNAQGMVYAIDIDRDGMDAEYVFQHLRQSHLPTNYVIYNRRISSRTHGPWTIRPYHGTSNPHTDHIHVSIVRANWAWKYDAGWGIARGSGRITGPTAPPAGEEPLSGTSWDYRVHVDNSADRFGELASAARNVALSARSLRRR